VEGEIGSAAAQVKVFVIPANEELVLAREVYRKVSTLN
jgi:acetate kinase